MLCDHLEGWDREGRREGDTRGKRYGDICICITDSLCYKAEANTPLLSNYTPIKMLKKKEKWQRTSEPKSDTRGLSEARNEKVFINDLIFFNSS